MKKIILAIFLLSSNLSMASSCTAEDDAMCPNVSSTREYAECMYKNLSKITSKCGSIIEIYMSCLVDIEELCPNVDSEHATFACLASNQNKLSNICKRAIQ